ncbi:MAG: hypothetical protein IJP68_10030 [Selenomonadaceae bacterium]|nr:hypothetical protein [Selenomonadaceae bacterium]
MSWLGLLGVEEYQRRLRESNGGLSDYSGLVEIRADLPPALKSDLNCPQRCGACWQAPSCAALKEFIEFAKETEPQGDFKALCQSGDRSNENFRNCMACKCIVHCEILRRVMNSE